MFLSVSRDRSEVIEPVSIKAVRLNLPKQQETRGRLGASKDAVQGQTEKIQR